MSESEEGSPPDGGIWEDEESRFVYFSILINPVAYLSPTCKVAPTYILKIMIMSRLDVDRCFYQVFPNLRDYLPTKPSADQPTQSEPPMSEDKLDEDIKEEDFEVPTNVFIVIN